MSEQNTPEVLQINEAVEQVRAGTEIALQIHFGQLPTTKPLIAKFAGKLSTIPSKVDSTISAEVLDNACGPFSKELKDAQRLVGINAEVAGGAYDIFKLVHIYLITKVNGIEVLVDASIGQFITGYNQVFIGTRQQLKELVLANSNSLRKKLPNESTDDFFKRIWGDTTYLMTQEAVNERRLQGQSDLL